MLLLKLIYKPVLYILYNLNLRLYSKYNNKFLRKLGVNINGEPDYIDYNVSFDSTDYSLITLGDKCTITGRTLILTHDYSIWNAAYSSGNITETNIDIKKLGKVTIGENSFIGANSIILPGVTIGKNSIVGAGSVVTKDVPDGIVVAGNPAKIICSTQEYYYKHIQLFKHNIY